MSDEEILALAVDAGWAVTHENAGYVIHLWRHGALSEATKVSDWLDALEAPHCPPQAPAKPRNRPGGPMTPDETAQAIYDAGWSYYVIRDSCALRHYWQIHRGHEAVDGLADTLSAALHAAHTAMTEAL